MVSAESSTHDSRQRSHFAAKKFDVVTNEGNQIVYNTADIRVLAIEPDDTQIYTPFVDYEEISDGTMRSTYTMAGTAVAIEVENHPEADANGLFYMHSDRLGQVVFSHVH